MSSAESQLNLLDIVLFAVRRSWVRMNFVVWDAEGWSVPCVCSIGSAGLRELALVIPRYKTDKFSLSLLPVTGHTWNLLPSDGFSGGTLSSLRVLWTYAYRGLSFIFSILYFGIFLLFYSMVLEPVWFIGGVSCHSSVCQVILIIIYTSPTLCLSFRDAVAKYSLQCLFY